MVPYVNIFYDYVSIHQMLGKDHPSLVNFWLILAAFWRIFSQF